MPKPAIEIEGAKELRRALRKLENKDLKKALSGANKKAAQVIATEAKTGPVPVRSGRLASSIRATGSQASGSVKAGRASVPYAGVIHFGWPARNIAAQPFIADTISEHASDARDVYEEAIEEVLRLIEAAL